jgi:hypothetical protein
MNFLCIYVNHITVIQTKLITIYFNKLSVSSPPHIHLKVGVTIYTE